MITICRGPINLINMPSDEADVPTDELWLDGSNASGLHAQTRVVTPGPSGARLEFRVWDGAAWVEALQDNAPYLLIDAEGYPLATGLGLSAEARSGWRRWKVISRNGDGETDVELGDVRVQLS